MKGYNIELPAVKMTILNKLHELDYIERCFDYSHAGGLLGLLSRDYRKQSVYVYSSKVVVSIRQY